MKTYEQLNEALILSNAINEMANLTTSDTGLSSVIWIGTVGGQHGPRIKVSNTRRGRMNPDSCFVLTIEKAPRLITPGSCKLSKDEVDDIKDWIQLNYETLMSLFNVYETGIGSSVDLLNQLKRI